MQATIAPVAEAGLEEILTHCADADALVHLRRLPPRPEQLARLRRPLPGAVAEALGVDRLWSHQVEALDHVREGRSVVIATGTASGKSVCYQAPIVEAAIADPPSTALLLFPTKALAHDQLRSLGQMRLPGLTPACYDGDSSQRERAWVRDHANVVLTNPEMLHHGILPNHQRWATFLMRLRYVVIDELHVLRGVFGSHVAHLLRRLRRLANHYGSWPTFVFASATIGEPGRLASQLCGLEVIEVTDDGSPSGARIFAMWNPPRDKSGSRSKAGGTTATLAAELVRRGKRAIAFCGSRKGAEVVAAQLREQLPASLSARVRAYRGGYLAEERREIEQQLADGTLAAVVATSALELGIDVGGLDASLMCGFPGTIASMWQRAGRAGREGDESLTVLVAGDDQLDQYLMSHPSEVFEREPEAAVVNPANPHVLLPHLACAAYELPLSHGDELLWPGLLDEGIRLLVRDGALRVRTRSEPRRSPSSGNRGPTAVWNGPGVPAHGVSLRSTGGRELRIVNEEGDLVGTVDQARAPSLVHPGAVYLHQGQSWLVTELDLREALVTVTAHDRAEYTQVRSETDIRVQAAECSKRVGRASLWLGEVEVCKQVTGFRRLASGSGKLLESRELDLPPSQLVTRAIWYTVDPMVLEAAGVVPARWPGALHAVEHAAIGMLPLFAICDRWDVGGVSTAHQAETGLPSIFIYDGYPGGIGIAELGFEAARQHLRATLEAVRDCGCSDGCPSCVQSPKCGNGNDPLDKAGATAVLEEILSG